MSRGSVPTLRRAWWIQKPVGAGRGGRDQRIRQPASGHPFQLPRVERGGGRIRKPVGAGGGRRKGKCDPVADYFFTMRFLGAAVRTDGRGRGARNLKEGVRDQVRIRDPSSPCDPLVHFFFTMRSLGVPECTEKKTVPKHSSPHKRPPVPTSEG